MKYIILLILMHMAVFTSSAQTNPVLSDPFFIDSTIKSFILKYYKNGWVEVEYEANSDKNSGVEITILAGKEPLTVYFTGKLKKGQKYKKIVQVFK